MSQIVPHGKQLSRFGLCSSHTGKRRWAFAAVFALTVLLPSMAFAQSATHQCNQTGTDTIAEYAVTKGQTLPAAIERRLTSRASNARRGLNWTVDPEFGNCIACHKIGAILQTPSNDNPEGIGKFGRQGDLGPALDGVADRYAEAELRMIIVDPKQAFPKADTIMPAYYSVSERHNVIEDCRNRVVLTAEQIEDIVAFLKTLKSKPEG